MYSSILAKIHDPTPPDIPAIALSTLVLTKSCISKVRVPKYKKLIENLIIIPKQKNTAQPYKIANIKLFTVSSLFIFLFSNVLMASLVALFVASYVNALPTSAHKPCSSSNLI
ncbi:putative membrane protein [Yersinia pestis CO92]|uniref:Membrane protein n=1 Tax=Yersinia pestis TaxID=632 RepID=Q0WE37_YERPE|nr:putative membrane protein [Yersinia pestis CA88-4125]CAL21115.1 putative membrane protein [Yersinia pestis CO92]